MNILTAFLPTTRMKSPGRGLKRFIVGVGILSGVVLVLMVIARLMSMQHGLSLAALPADFEGPSYIKHPLLALMHLIPGTAFVVLGALQFSMRIRIRWPRFHRVSGRVFALSGISMAMSGIWMNEIFPPVGGVLKYVGALFFGIAMIVSIVLGIAMIKRRDITAHRLWMARAFAIGLGTGTQRLIIMPIFLFFGMPSETTIGVCMWLGWFVALGATEWMVRRTVFASAAGTNSNLPG